MARKQGGCGVFTAMACVVMLSLMYYSLVPEGHSSSSGYANTIQDGSISASLAQTTSAVSIELLQNQLSDIGISPEHINTDVDVLIKCGIVDLTGIHRENGEDDDFNAFSLKLTQERRANILTADGKVFYIGVNGHDLYTNKIGLSGETVDDFVAYVDKELKERIYAATEVAIKSIVKYPDTVSTGMGWWAIARDNSKYEVIVTASYKNAIGEPIGDYYLVNLSEKSGNFEFTKATSQSIEEERLMSIVGKDLAMKTISFFDYGINYTGRYTPLRFINQQSDLALLFISSGLSRKAAYDKSYDLVNKCISYAFNTGMSEPHIFKRVYESYRDNDFSLLETIRFNI